MSRFESARFLPVWVLLLDGELHKVFATEFLAREYVKRIRARNGLHLRPKVEIRIMHVE